MPARSRTCAITTTTAFKLLVNRCTQADGDGVPTPGEEFEEFEIHAQALHGELIAVEREHLLILRNQGAIADEIFRMIEHELDLEELRFGSHAGREN